MGSYKVKYAAMLLTGVASVGIQISSPALAQGTERPQQTTASDQTIEIIVTAQRRAERTLDVPISITAVRSEEIAQRGLVSEEDFLRGMPGVTQANGPFGTTIIIRGISTDPKPRGGVVGSYFGETETSNALGSGDIKLVDMQRVEVLKGPQGTAFGATALGGLLRVIPEEPKLNTLEGRLAAGASFTAREGGFNNMGQAVLNVPVIEDKVALRAVAYRFDNSGYYENVSGSSPGFQTYSAGFGAQNVARDAKDVGARRYTGGRISALVQPIDNLKLSLLYLHQETELDGYEHAGTIPAFEGLASLSPYQQLGWQVAPQHVVRGQKQGVGDSNLDFVNITAEYDLGWGSLLATASHIDTNDVNAFAFPLFLPFSQRIHNHKKQDSAEVRVVTSLDGPLDFIGGIYYLNAKNESIADYHWLGSLPNLFDGRQTTDLGGQIDTGKTVQKAVYGEVTWKIVPAVSITGGARMFNYSQDTDQIRSGPIFGNGTTTLSGGETGEVYKLNITYKPNDRANIYASFSQGFRLGGPSSGLPSNRCDINPADGLVDGTNLSIEATRFIRSDKLDQYELGTKLSLFDRRVAIEAAIFRIDWKDVPFGLLAPGGINGCGFGFAFNAGTVRSEGAEAQITLRPAAGLQLELSGSYTDSRLHAGVSDVGLPVDKGDRTPGSPKVNAGIGAMYDFSMFARRASIRVDSIYVGSFYSDFKETPDNRSGDYWKVDLSGTLNLSDALSLNAFVRNIFNENAFTFKDDGGRGATFGPRMQPRTIGAQLDFRF